MKKIATTFALLFALTCAFGCGDDSNNCKSACDKLSSCGLKSSGLSCDTSCTQGGCANCVNDKSCDDISNNACANACPGVSFTKK